MQPAFAIAATVLFLLNFGRILRVCFWVIVIAPALIGILTQLGMAGQQKAQHDKVWYIVHPEERAALLRICRSDASYDRAFDCLNADAAEYAEVVQKQSAAGGLSYFDSPEYLAANPIERKSRIRLCANQSPGSDMYTVARCHSVEGQR